MEEGREPPLSRASLEVGRVSCPGPGLPGAPAASREPRLPPHKASASARKTTRRTPPPPRARPQLPPPDQIPGRRPAAEVTWPAPANRSAAAGRAQPRPAAVGLSDPGGCADRCRASERLGERGEAQRPREVGWGAPGGRGVAGREAAPARGAIPPACHVPAAAARRDLQSFCRTRPWRAESSEFATRSRPAGRAR